MRSTSSSGRPQRRCARATATSFWAARTLSKAGLMPSRYRTLGLEAQNGERFGGGSVPVRWVYDKETKKELVRATTPDDVTITFGSMVQFPDPLHRGAYPS